MARAEVRSLGRLSPGRIITQRGNLSVFTEVECTEKTTFSRLTFFQWRQKLKLFLICLTIEPAVAFSGI